MHTTFRDHALQRASERLSLSLEEIARILDHDLCVPLGRDGPRKVHKLFWSEPDSYWFVAVQDESDGEVVTIFPVDYHNRWEVAFDVLEEARRLMS